MDFSNMQSRAAEDSYVPPIEDRLHNIIGTINDDEEVEKALPGLAGLLESYVESKGSIDQEDFARRLLLVFKESPDQTYENTLNNYDPDERKALQNFVDGMSLKEATIELPLGPTLGARQEAQDILLGDVVDLPLATEPSLEDDDEVHIQTNGHD